MIILNLGCGSKVSDHNDVINIDWSIMLRFRKVKWLRFIAPIILDKDRLTRFNSFPDNIFALDLSKGIPYPDNSVDAVYHSHLLEHLTKPVAINFLKEIKRVLKPGGIHRIVVPNFEYICQCYVNHLARCEASLDEQKNHDSYIDNVVGMMVVSEGYDTSKQKPLRRFVENLVLGDANKRGLSHKWMYDRFSLRQFMSEVGYREITVCDYANSSIPNWEQYKLDLNKDGDEFRPNSLYMEGVK